MTSKWPQFITHDLGDSDEDDMEMQRRWEEYDRQMKAIIAAGGVHQDADGWWVDDTTGELIGPDPEIERPMTDEELARLRPAKDVLPPSFFEAVEKARRARGRPHQDKTKDRITIRMDHDLVEHYKSTGKGWQSRMNADLRKVSGL